MTRLLAIDPGHKSNDQGTITLHIPCLPDLDLSSNRRRSRHYYAQARDTKAERERAAVLLREGD